jgi:two-component system, NtrC family, sensor kinase
VNVSNKRKTPGRVIDPLKPEGAAERSQELEQLYRSAPYTITGAISSGVAHDINNPLTAVLGFSGALLARACGNEDIDRNELSSYLQVVHDEAIRCRDIIDHLHRFARGEGGTKAGPASLLDAVSLALRLVKTNAARAEVTVVLELHEDRRVRTEAVRLEQIIVSLLLNRIDCSSPGTTVTVSAPDNWKSDCSEKAVLIVSDEFDKLTPAELDFFFRCSGPGNRIVTGLAFCRTAVEEMGGRFDCIVRTGKGTSVRIEFPAYATIENRGQS